MITISTTYITVPTIYIAIFLMVVFLVPYVFTALWLKCKFDTWIERKFKERIERIKEEDSDV
jgi:hypothetical protein